MKKLFLPLALALGVGGAYAGSTQDQTVYIDTAGRNAQAYLSSVQNSTNMQEIMYCTVYTSTAGAGSKMGYCYASNGKNNLSCTTYDATMMSTIAALDGDGGMYFASDAAGMCTTLWVQKSSYIVLKKR